MVNETLLKSIGKQIAQKRMTVRMNQEAVDRGAGLPIGTIRKLETGKINITLETLDKICTAMDCRLDITIRKIIHHKSVIEDDLF